MLSEMMIAFMLLQILKFIKYFFYNAKYKIAKNAKIS